MSREQERRERGEQDPDVHSGLKHGGYPGSPATGPRLREQGRADGPLAADPQRCEEPNDEQLPPSLCKEGEPRERRVGEDGEAERSTPADEIAYATEESTAERPADQERGLDPRAVPADSHVPSVGHPDEFGYEWGFDQDIEVHVQAIE
jgi:hypothetical protein